MKNIVCIIARVNSVRLDQKVLKEAGGLKLIEYLIKKIKRSQGVDQVYLCTSIDQTDKILLEIAEANGVFSYAGSRESVIDRMLKVAEKENADNLVRITGDNIFTDETYLDLMLEHHSRNNSDYTRTEFLPLGVTAEIIRTEALLQCRKTINPNHSQYLMLYLFQPEKYNCQVLIPEESHRHPEWSLSVDTEDDWQRTTEIIGSGKGILDYAQIIDICHRYKISNLHLDSGYKIKLPAGDSIFYAEFRRDIEARIEKSHTVQLRKGEYQERLHEKKL